MTLSFAITLVLRYLVVMLFLPFSAQIGRAHV